MGGHPYLRARPRLRQQAPRGEDTLELQDPLDVVVEGLVNSLPHDPSTAASGLVEVLVDDLLQLAVQATAAAILEAEDVGCA
jgi:hypothetical protein